MWKLFRKSAGERQVIDVQREALAMAERTNTLLEARVEHWKVMAETCEAMRLRTDQQFAQAITGGFFAAMDTPYNGGTKLVLMPTTPQAVSNLFARDAKHARVYWLEFKHTVDFQPPMPVLNQVYLDGGKRNIEPNHERPPWAKYASLSIGLVLLDGRRVGRVYYTEAEAV